MAYNCRDGWPTIAEMGGLQLPKYTIIIKEDLLKKEIVGKTTYYLTNNDLVSLK